MQRYQLTELACYRSDANAFGFVGHRVWLHTRATTGDVERDELYSRHNVYPTHAMFLLQRWNFGGTF